MIRSNQEIAALMSELSAKLMDEDDTFCIRRYENGAVEVGIGSGPYEFSESYRLEGEDDDKLAKRFGMVMR